MELTMSGLVPVLFGHAAFQQLNAASELGLFDLLQARPGSSAAAVARELGLPARSVDVLLLGTTSLGLTRRRGHDGGDDDSDGSDGDRFWNCQLIESAYADGTWADLANIVEFQAKIAYLPAMEYTSALRSGRNEGLRHIPGDTEDLYSRLANVPGLEELFYRCMNSWSRISNPVLVDGVDYTDVRRILDVGGGGGLNAITLARRHPHLRITVLDRPGALKLAEENIEQAGLSHRIDTFATDIFDGDYPDGHDCVLFAHQMVIWTPEQNRSLLAKAFGALPAGGRVLIFNAFSSDDGAGPLYAGLDGVYFATLPFQGSTIYPWKSYEQWLADTGFVDTKRITIDTWTPHGVVESIRPDSVPAEGLADDR